MFTTHTIHALYIDIHLLDFLYKKCHTWLVWAIANYGRFANGTTGTPLLHLPGYFPIQASDLGASLETEPLRQWPRTTKNQ